MMLGWIWVAGFAAFALTVPAQAQTSIDAGKTPPQIFQSDCSPCHKSAQGLYKGMSPMLQSFLRQHYTSSREVAAMMADYLAAQDKGPAAKPAAPQPRRPREARPKPGETKPGDAKPADASGESQPASTPAATAPSSTAPAAAPTPAPAAPPPASVNPGD